RIVVKTPVAFLAGGALRLNGGVALCLRLRFFALLRRLWRGCGGPFVFGGSFTRPGVPPLHGRIFGPPIDLGGWGDLLPGRRLAGLWRYPALGFAGGAVLPDAA